MSKSQHRIGLCTVGKDYYDKCKRKATCIITLPTVLGLYVDVRMCDKCREMFKANGIRTLWTIHAKHTLATTPKQYRENTIKYIKALGLEPII